MMNDECNWWKMIGQVLHLVINRAVVGVGEVPLGGRAAEAHLMYSNHSFIIKSFPFLFFWVFGDFRKQAHLRLVQTLEDIGTGIPVVSCIRQGCPHWGNHGNTSQSYRVSDQNDHFLEKVSWGPPMNNQKSSLSSHESHEKWAFKLYQSRKNEHFLKQWYAETILNKSIFAESPNCLFVMFYPS